MQFVTEAQLHPLTDVVQTAVAPLAGPLRGVGCVLHNACPVPFFGDAATARIATVGLNPSHGEFEDGPGQLRAASRLPSRAALGVDDWAEASEGVFSRIAQACSHYFKGNPYWKWFNTLERMLERTGRGTFSDGGACHLDLVPWATRPIWGHLNEHERRLLLRQGRPVLHELLASLRVEALLLNGTTVVDSFQHDAGDRLQYEYVDNWQIGRGTGRRWWGCVDQIGGYRLPRPVTVLGWSGNLQSSFIRIAVRQSIVDWVAAELS